MLSENREKPSLDTVKAFCAWIQDNGMHDNSFSNEAEYAAHAEDRQRRIYGIAALGARWAARVGQNKSFPSGRSFQIWRMSNLGSNALGVPAGNYDANSGNRCSLNGVIIDDKVLGMHELSESDLQELSAAFQAQGTTDAVRKETLQMREGFGKD